MGKKQIKTKQNKRTNSSETAGNDHVVAKYFSFFNIKLEGFIFLWKMNIEWETKVHGNKNEDFQHSSTSPSRHHFRLHYPPAFLFYFWVISFKDLQGILFHFFIIHFFCQLSFRYSPVLAKATVSSFFSSFKHGYSIIVLTF